MSVRSTALYNLLATPMTTNRAAKEIAIDVFLTDYDGNPANIEVDSLGILNIFYPEPSGYPAPPGLNEGGGTPGDILKRNRNYSDRIRQYNNPLPGRSNIKNIMES